MHSRSAPPPTRSAIRSRLDRDRGVTIIGGGATGVQLAGAISASRAAAVVRIVEAESELLATMSRESSDGAARILRDRGVEVRLDAKVERITDEGVEVDGEALDGLVVWAGGFVPRTDGARRRGGRRRADRRGRLPPGRRA